MRCRVLYKGDDILGIIYPVAKSRRENETEEQWLLRVFEKATADRLMRLNLVPDGVYFVDIDSSELPHDRSDRDAWICKNGKIEVSEKKKAEQKAKAKPTIDDIENAKTIADLKALVKKMV